MGGFLGFPFAAPLGRITDCLTHVLLPSQVSRVRMEVWGRDGGTETLLRQQNFNQDELAFVGHLHLSPEPEQKDLDLE